MGKKYRVEYNRPGCIGAGACVAAGPDFWTLAEGGDAKADLKASLKPRKEGDYQYLEFDEKDLQQNLDAAQACPVQVIKIVDVETGEVLFPK
jgi:ferredoxin